MTIKHVPPPVLRRLAKHHEIKLNNGLSYDELVQLIARRDGMMQMMQHLDKQFKYVDKPTSVTVCRPNEDFPSKSSTAQAFLAKLVEEGHVTANQVGTWWKPEKKSGVQIYGVEQIDDDVFLKLVKKRERVSKGWFEADVEEYSDFASAVIQFNDEVIQLRCTQTESADYLVYILKLIGFPANTKVHPLTDVTKEEAREICEYLKASVASSQIDMSSTVGSIKFDGTKGVDLKSDETLAKIKEAIQQHTGLSADNTSKETCVFNYPDPITGLDFPVAFEINIRKGTLKFGLSMTQDIVDFVLNAFRMIDARKKAQAKTPPKEAS